MKLIKNVDIMENKKMIVWLNIATLPLLVLFLFLFGLFATRIAPFSTDLAGEFSIGGMFGELVFFFLLILLHEGIHGFFFKVFNPKGKVKFGFKNGFAYATSPQSFYKKGQFAVISLSPFVLISAGLMGLFGLELLSVFSFVFLASLHAAACVGDFYFTYLLATAPKSSLVEDTETGINFYVNE